MMIRKIWLSLSFVLVGASVFAQTKIAFADMNYIMNQMPEAQTIDTQIREYETQLGTEIQTMGQQLQQGVQEYESTSGTMTQDAKTAKEQELQTMQQQLQQKQQQAQVQLQQKYAELLSPVRDKVMTAIETVAEANGYTHVFSKGVSGSLIALYPDADDNSFSDLVLKELGVAAE